MFKNKGFSLEKQIDVYELDRIREIFNITTSRNTSF